MRSNQIWLIVCLILAVTLTLVLFVESKRPIYVDITLEEINKEMCKDYGNEKNENKKEAEKEGQSTRSKREENHNKEKEKGDLNGG